MGELVAVRPQQDVLHPRADVGRERAAPHDAEVAVGQRRHRGAGRPGAVAVDECVGRVLGLWVVGQLADHVIRSGRRG